MNKKPYSSDSTSTTNVSNSNSAPTGAPSGDGPSPPYTHQQQQQQDTSSQQPSEEEYEQRDHVIMRQCSNQKPPPVLMSENMKTPTTFTPEQIEWAKQNAHRIHVFAFMNHVNVAAPHPMLCTFLSSAGMFGLNQITVYGVGNKKRAKMMLPIFRRELVHAMKNVSEDTFALVVDATDSVFVNTPEQMLMAYQALGKPDVVLQSDAGLLNGPNVREYYHTFYGDTLVQRQERSEVMLYPCTGFYFATVKNLRTFMGLVMPPKAVGGIDQAWVAQNIYAQRLLQQNKWLSVVLDIYGQMSANMNAGRMHKGGGGGSLVWPQWNKTFASLPSCDALTFKCPIDKQKQKHNFYATYYCKAEDRTSLLHYAGPMKAMLVKTAFSSWYVPSKVLEKGFKVAVRVIGIKDSFSQVLTVGEICEKWTPPFGHMKKT